MTSLLPAGAFNEKLPSTSVGTAVLVPFSVTVAPMMGSPFSSSTCPLTCFTLACCTEYELPVASVEAALTLRVPMHKAAEKHNLNNCFSFIALNIIILS